MLPKPSTTIVLSLLATAAAAAAHAFYFDPGESVMNFLKGYTVRVTNTITDTTNPMICHCYSKDDDFGDRRLKLQETLEWKFGMDLLGRTVYTCSFRWGGKRKSLEVFNWDLTSKCTHWPFAGDSCSWFVKEDGFSLGELDNKVYDW